MKKVICLLLGTISAIQIQELAHQKHKVREEPEQVEDETSSSILGQEAISTSESDVLEEFHKKMAKAREEESQMTSNLIQGKGEDKLEYVAPIETTEAKKAEAEVPAKVPEKEKDFVVNHKSGAHLANDKKSAWNGLTDKEKNYAYYLSEAEIQGARMIPHQLSYESPPLKLLLSSFFQDKNLDQLTQAAIKSKIEKKTFLNFVLYSAGVFENYSNYNSYGSKKFVPELLPAEFEAIFKSNPLFKTQGQKGDLYRKAFKEIYPQIKEEIFNYQKPFASLGYPEEGGITGYFSRSIKKEDLNLIKEFLKAQKVEILNTRAFKEGDKYIITVGSIEDKNTKRNITFKGKKFDIEYGEFSPYLQGVVSNLQLAKKYAKNDDEKHMIEKYIQSFTTGSIEDHKNSQREWIKDKIPEVETNMGWIEHYTDPSNQRAIWEGFVAIVNKKRTENLTKLVNKGPEILKFLPWEKNIEKNKFLAPDFTSLDMIEWHGEGEPSGINIPNYYDIKDNEGFKNLLVEDDPKSTIKDKTKWRQVAHSKTKEESDNMYAVYSVGNRLSTAGHEMFGHGSGKLLFKDKKTGKCPLTLADPQTGESINSCYNEDQNYQTLFDEIGSSYEECKAEATGLYLLKFKEMYEDFDITKDNANATWKDMLQTEMFEMATGGLDTLPGSYSAETKKWKQAHSQARYVIFEYIMQNQKSKIIDVEMKRKEGKIVDYFVTIDKEMMATEGWELVKKLLQTLQVYKSTAAIEKASAFYEKYSVVTPEFLELRASLASKDDAGGQMMRFYSQIDKNGDRTPTFVDYPGKFQGLIYTFMDKIQFNNVEYDQVMTEWNKHKSTLKVSLDEQKAFLSLAQDEEQIKPNYIQSNEIEEEFKNFGQLDDDSEE